MRGEKGATFSIIFRQWILRSGGRFPKTAILDDDITCGRKLSRLQLEEAPSGVRGAQQPPSHDRAENSMEI